MHNWQELPTPPAAAGRRHFRLVIRTCSFAPRGSSVALVLFLLLAHATGARAVDQETWLTANGTAAVDRFGWGVGPSCDVDGDGLDDVMVGAPLSDAAGVNAGRVAIFLGRRLSPTSSSPNLYLNGQAAGEEFGYSLAPAGDMNGDGWADVIVGAPFNDAGGTDAGRAYVFFLGPNGDAVPDLAFTGAAAGDNLGISVSAAGDVNGDGYDDVIVGAPKNDAGGTDAGRAYVYFGGAVPNGVADLTLTGAAAGDNFGARAAGGLVERGSWDVNGDGYGDVIVGAPFSDAGGADAGRAYVFYGGGDPDPSSDLLFTGAAPGDQFGASVRTLGDTNGDGFGDAIVGAPMNDTGGTDAGRVYVFLGGPLADAVADLTLSGQGAGDNFGASVASAGDVNGDGFEDALVGAPLNDAGGSNAGRAYVYFGGASPNIVADLFVTGAAANDSTGASVASAGDVNGDGFTDLMVGAPTSMNGTLTFAGRASVTLVYPYRVLAPNGGETWVGGGPVTVRWLGHEVADIALSIDAGRTWETIASSAGGASGENEYRLTCPSDVTTAALVRVSKFGTSPSHASSDVSDRVFRIALPTTPPPVASRLRLEYDDATVGDHAGAALAAADVNGDGREDLLVGAPGGPTSPGRVLVFIGGGDPEPSDAPDMILIALQVGEMFGAAVANAGDVNGDGFDDVIVGAPLNDAAGTDAGRAYLFYGGGSPDPGVDLTLTGAAAGDHFGAAVAGGDINLDGYSDLLVGAPLNDAAGTDAGRAYVYIGGGNPDPGQDLTLTGTAAGDHFGSAVAFAGKGLESGSFIDQAVVDYFLVAAPLNDEAGVEAGRVYGYAAGAVPLSTPKLSLGGHAPGERFGTSLSAAGDVLGDGSVHFLAGVTITGVILPEDRPVGYIYATGGAGSGRALMGLVPATSHDIETRVANAGDVNGDGFHDAVAGLFDVFLPQDPEWLPRVYLYPGGIIQPNDVGSIISPEDLVGIVDPQDSFFAPLAGEGFGVAVAGIAGGDGFSDVVIGANLSNAGASGGGRVFLHDLNRFHLTRPTGGETWNVGGLQDISWLGAARANVELSVDGGATWSRLAENVGGQRTNSLSLRVPHVPTRFARIRMSDCEPPFNGSDVSDSLFTIRSSVTLLTFTAQPTAEGAALAWSSNPPVGPDGLLGYRLYRLAAGAPGSGTRVGPELITETRYLDRDGASGSTWRLTAVNGLHEEIELGRETSGTAIVGLRVWPSPASAGTPIRVAFAAPLSSLGFPASDLDVAVFDVAGRRLATLARGALAAKDGRIEFAWDGRFGGGAAAAGLYFVRATAPSVGFKTERRLAIIR